MSKKKKMRFLSKISLPILTAFFISTSLLPSAYAATYTVRAGDTLYNVGRLYDTTIETIQNANGLKSHLIYPGQKLIIPGAKQVKGKEKPVTQVKKQDQSGKVTYTVQPGDCLSLIALRYGTSVQAVMSASDIDSILIHPGQTLIIPTHSQSVNIKAQSANPPSRGGSQPARDILTTAARLLGSRYVYGGSGPYNFDCSGFVSYVFRSAGFNLPHDAEAQASLGVSVEKASLQPGDLVFFGYHGSREIGHVGIYAGGDKFIHASSSGGVMYSLLGEDYYRQNYRGARRLL